MFLKKNYVCYMFHTKLCLHQVAIIVKYTHLWCFRTWKHWKETASICL